MPNISKAHEHLNAAIQPPAEEEQVLDEARGVGVLNVPPALLQRVQKFIGSVLLTMAVMKQHDLQNKGQSEKATALLNWCKRFQRKYNASVLSPNDLKKYVNSSTNLKLDADEIFNQLPDNLKKNPKTKELIDKMRITMKISNQFIDKAGSSGTDETYNELDLGVPNYNAEIKNSNDINAIVDHLNYFMDTVQHELQHTIQSVVLKNLNPNDQQTMRAKGYSGSHTSDDRYYAGGVEFGPQVQDLALRATQWLENNKDELTGNKNKDISNSIQYSMKTLGQSKIISVLRKYKEDARANKAMKLIYKFVSNFYDNDLNQDEDHEFDSSEKDISDGHHSQKSLDYPEAGQSLMGDLYLRVWREFDQQPTTNNNVNMEDPEQFTLFVDGGYQPSYSVVFRKRYENEYFLLVKEGDEKKLRIDLTKEQMASLPIEYLGNMRNILKLKDKLEDESTPDANLHGLLFAVENLAESAEFLNQDSTKKITFNDYIEDEGFFEIEMAGVKFKMTVQASGKKYSLDINGGENMFNNLKEQDFESFTNKLFDSYYKPEVEPRHISKALINASDIADFDERLDYYVDRTANRRKRGEEAMAESSMRGLADIIQNAELEHDIDDADEQELINKDQLQEMPQRFDAFADADPVEFVDKTAKLNSRDKMVPVAEHDGFSVAKSKNGSGYMAYDDSGNEIAVVSGQLIGKVFHIEAIAAKRGRKGIVYQMYMDIIKSGLQILSDTLHSDDAIRFWQKLITNHEVYVVADGEVIQRATPEKFHKYWGDEDSPSADLQFLLVN